MFWIPVLFVCLNSGECHFIYDKPEVAEKACIKAVSDGGAKVEKFPNVQGWKGTCIPVTNGKTI